MPEPRLMDTIVPRWEWRTFCGNLNAIRQRLSAVGSTGVEESDEVYLLSSLCDASVKIRTGLLDVKQLEQRDPSGLELYRPVLKADFPLPASTVAQIFEILRLPVPVLSLAAFSQVALLDELVKPEPNLRTLSVHKVRTRYRIGDCLVEMTDVLANGRSVRTFAVESEDRVAMLQTVRELGLSGVPHQNYPRALRDLIGLTGPSLKDTVRADAMRYAAIDVGTNSVKLHVAERDGTGSWHRVLDRIEVTRLGERLQETGEIQPAAQARTVAVIADMVAQAKSVGAQAIVAVGTMGLRQARNSRAFLEDVRATCGISIEVIDGKEEARLAYLAVQVGLGVAKGSVVVFDTGGGSTQVTLGDNGNVLEQFSLNLGAVRLTEEFGLHGAVDHRTLRSARAAIARELIRLDSIAPPDALVGMGGAVTNMAAVSLGLVPYDPDRIQGAILTFAEIERQIGAYAELEVVQRQDIPGLQPGRAEIILAGACIVATLMEKLHQDRLTVSDRALRHGILIDRF
jgi:exopolyphosphatase/guanosine-5'-triphosphate,3'-diphosphate pyrophosphatase